MFIDSSQHFDSGKNQNKLSEDHINHIVDTYRQFNEGKLKLGIVEEKFSYVASFDEISENDFNLNIPRYVDTFEEEAEINIQVVQQDIELLEVELKTVQIEMESYLKELGV